MARPAGALPRCQCHLGLALSLLFTGQARSWSGTVYPLYLTTWASRRSPGSRTGPYCFNVSALGGGRKKTLPSETPSPADISYQSLGPTVRRAPRRATPPIGGRRRRRSPHTGGRLPRTCPTPAWCGRSSTPYGRVRDQLAARPSATPFSALPLAPPLTTSRPSLCPRRHHPRTGRGAPTPQGRGPLRPTCEAAPPPRAQRGRLSRGVSLPCFVAASVPRAPGQPPQSARGPTADV